MRTQPRHAADGLDRGVVLTGDDVRRGHDELRRGNPTAARDAEPARSTEHLQNRGRGLPNRRVGEHARVGRRDRSGRSGDRGERVDARERAHQLRGRDDAVQLLQDGRALHALAQPRLARELERDGAEHPNDRDACGRTEEEPTRGVERARGAELDLAPQDAPGDGPERLEQHSAHRCAGEPNERCVRRLGALSEQVRREPSADHRADDDARHRERARDQPLPVAEERREGDEEEREPVDAGHTSQRSRACGGRPARLGRLAGA